MPSAWHTCSKQDLVSEMRSGPSPLVFSAGPWGEDAEPVTQISFLFRTAARGFLTRDASYLRPPSSRSIGRPTIHHKRLHLAISMGF